jgi:hypothetical protein
MLFSDLYKSPRSPLSKLRHGQPQPAPLAMPQQVDHDADLLSKDKAKQKEAVKRYLAEKIRNDWEFVWPPVANGPPEHEFDGQAVTEAPEDAKAAAEDGTESTDENDADSEDGDDDAASTYSTVSEDNAHFRPRADWASELSDNENPAALSPFRFDNPDAVGATIHASILARRSRRRRALRKEMEWNDGLACFEARRDAWTGAKTVRVHMKTTSPTTSFASLSPRRLFFRPSVPNSPAGIPISPQSPNSHNQQRQSGDASAGVSDSSDPSKDGTKDFSKQFSKESTRSNASRSSQLYPVETLLPIPPPLLPPGNPMRSSITSAVYLSLYDKVVVHSLMPSCPINLKDMVRSCVAGWKRDGEWPPRPTAQDPGTIAVRRKKKASNDQTKLTRRMSFGFLNRGEKPEKAEKDEEAAGTGKGIRRSLQRVLGLGHGHSTPAPAVGAGDNATLTGLAGKDGPIVG